jgi:hypothetical protein
MYKGVLVERCLAVVVLALSIAIKNGRAEEAVSSSMLVT